MLEPVRLEQRLPELPSRWIGWTFCNDGSRVVSDVVRSIEDRSVHAASLQTDRSDQTHF